MLSLAACDSRSIRWSGTRRNSAHLVSFGASRRQHNKLRAVLPRVPAVRGVCGVAADPRPVTDWVAKFASRSIVDAG